MKRAFEFVLTYVICLTIVFGVEAQEVAPKPQEKKTPVPKSPVVRKIKDDVPPVPPSFTGPKTAKPTQTVLLDFNGDIGSDPKFDAVPKPETFRVFKDFSGKLVLLITPGDALTGKSILVVYADTRSNKTILATYSLDVQGIVIPPGPGPKPPVPPEPIKLKYYAELKAAYLVSPDAASLDILNGIYKELGGSTFNKNSDAATVLRNICAKKLKPTDLRAVRDAVHTLLDAELGTSDANPFNATTFKQFWADITAALDAIKAGK